MSLKYNEETAVPRVRYPKNYDTTYQNSDFEPKDSMIQEMPAQVNYSLSIDRGDDTNGHYEATADQRFIATYASIAVQKLSVGSVTSQYYYIGLKGYQIGRVEIHCDLNVGKEVNQIINLPNYLVEVGDIMFVDIGGSASGTGRSHYIIGGYLV